MYPSGYSEEKSTLGREYAEAQCVKMSHCAITWTDAAVLRLFRPWDAWDARVSKEEILNGAGLEETAIWIREWG